METTELKQAREYASLLEELCYYAVREKIGVMQLLNILPKNKSISEKTNSLQSLLRFIDKEITNTTDRERLQLLRADYLQL